MSLNNLRNTINKLEQFNWGAELETIVTTNTDALVQLQELQLYEGIDSKGSQITLDGRGYSKKTFEIKTAKGQPTDRVTWKDTGALYSSLEAILTSNSITFTSVSEEVKFNIMIERSGPDVIGLDEEKRLQFATNITLPAIKQIFNDKTGFVIS